MENLVKKIVKEEMQKYNNEKLSGSSKEEKQSGSNIEEKPSGSKKRTPEIVTRMNSLLNRVTKTKKTTSGKQKPMTVQVRYCRDVFGVKEFVSPKEGGGSRFITFQEHDRSPTFQDLLKRSFDIYFLDRENYYGERKENVNITMLDITERNVELDEKILDYLQKRGLYSSKTWFIFKTTNAVNEIKEEQVYEQVLVKDESDTAIDLSSDSDSSPIKRKICHICAKTYYVTCINCSQNREFSESLANDQAKEDLSASHVADHAYSIPSTTFNIKELIEKSKSIAFVNTKELILFFQEHIQQGRRLDLDSLDDVCLGETNNITVDRENIVKTTFDELKFIKNFRLTFRVDFLAEEAVDHGGPRKEWIEMTNRELNNTYFQNGLRELLFEDYYYVGIMLALAFIQNGHQHPPFHSTYLLCSNKIHL